MVSYNEFLRVTELIISNLEGGYYHPELHKNVPGVSNMGISGETMFGLDRKCGQSGTASNSAKWKKFWDTLDKYRNGQYWGYNYKGGQYEKELKTLAAQVMIERFENYCSFFSPEASKIVKGSKKLLLHFIYATWNGAGWFARWARGYATEQEKKEGKIYANINEKIKTEKNADKLFEFCMSQRRNTGNKLFCDGAEKLENIVKNNPSVFKSSKKKKILKIFLVVGLALGVGYGVYKCFWEK